MREYDWKKKLIKLNSIKILLLYGFVFQSQRSKISFKNRPNEQSRSVKNENKTKNNEFHYR